VRVAHIGNYKPDSANGVNKAIAGFVKHLPRQGIDVELWHFSTKQKTVATREIDGAHVFDLPAYELPLGVAGLPKPSRDFVRQRATQVDLLHCHSVFVAHNLFVARSGRPYVVTPHGGYSHEATRGSKRVLKQGWLYLWEKSYLRGAAAIQAVSVPEVEDIKYLGRAADVFLIPNGVEEELVETSVSVPSSGDAWVYLGRLASDHKGLDLLLKGYAHIATESPHRVPTLVLAGPDFRNGMSQLIQLAHELGIEKKVQFPGPLHGVQKTELLNRAKLFIHTSRWEGMPFAVLEALALGRPVFLTPETNLSEQVADFNAGWVVNGTPEAIADGFRRILVTGDDELDHRGRQARLLVRERFCWPSIARELSNVYRSIAQ
jgi:glycosyltransferase involved in cell wall biosynthesis